jgi:hypothetical protein
MQLDEAFPRSYPNLNCILKATEINVLDIRSQAGCSVVVES